MKYLIIALTILITSCTASNNTLKTGRDSNHKSPKVAVNTVVKPPVVKPPSVTVPPVVKPPVVKPPVVVTSSCIKHKNKCKNPNFKKGQAHKKAKKAKKSKKH